MSYNAQMTYDFGTDRLYLHATYHTKQLAMSSGMYMFMLGEGTPELVNLGKISVQTAPGRTTKQGDAYLGLLCSIPTAEQTPVGNVNGILLNKTVGRLALGESFQLTGKVRPSNAANQAITWSSSDENVAKVDANGLVTSVAAGNVVITATSVETGVTATCTLTVVDMTASLFPRLTRSPPSTTPSTASTPSCRTPRRLRSRPSAAARTSRVLPMTTKAACTMSSTKAACPTSTTTTSRRSRPR